MFFSSLDIFLGVENLSVTLILFFQIYMIGEHSKNQALIINIIEFEKANYRTGADQDTKLLKRLLPRLRFDVTDKQNLSKEVS